MEEASTQTKRCPMCGEEVLAVAIKCKHCGARIVRWRPSRMQYFIALAVFCTASLLVGMPMAYRWFGPRMTIRGALEEAHACCERAMRRTYTADALENGLKGCEIRSKSSREVNDRALDGKGIGDYVPPYLSEALQTGDRKALRYAVLDEFRFFIRAQYKLPEYGSEQRAQITKVWNDFSACALPDGDPEPSL